MKKSLLYLATFSSLFYFLNLEATTAFLTSEKKQSSSISTGTNEDVFTTETTSINLNTQVTKKVKITRSKGKSATGGGQKDHREVKITVSKGAQKIAFTPQRAHLDLEVENLTVTGDAADEVIIEKIEEEDVPTFRITHDDIGAKDERVTGVLHVTALGGFYHVQFPISIVTSFNENTKVTETPSAPPGGSPTPPPSNTPSPQTPAPETPAPDTPAPETPPPNTPTPETPAPETPAPDTPTPETPPPNTPTPDTPAPETPTPETPAPDTPAPDTPSPDTPTDPPTPPSGGEGSSGSPQYEQPSE